MPVDRQLPPDKPAQRPGPGLLIAYGALAAFGAYFYLRQRRGHVGGPISTPKTFWLAYTLGTWYVTPFFFWRDERISPELRRLFAVHLVPWIGRAFGELYLMGQHRWKPPYGMLFNSADFGLLLGLLLQAARFDLESPQDRNAVALLALMAASLIPETTFAWLFHSAMEGHTETIWFADESPRFRFINRLTLGVDLAVYASLVSIAVQYYRGLPGRNLREVFTITPLNVD